MICYMRIINSIQTCRNIVRYYAPFTRALSVSDQTAEAELVHLAPQFSTATAETSRKNVQSIDHLNRSQKRLHIGTDEQKKIKFLMRKSNFLAEINDMTQSEVEVEVNTSKLDLTGLPKDILLLEKKLYDQLCNVKTVNLELSLPAGTILGFQSPEQLISKLKTASNVLVELRYDHISDKTVVTATGIKEDVNTFQKELTAMIDTVVFHDFVLPPYLLSSKDFSNLYKNLNELTDTILSVQCGKLTVWTSDASKLDQVQKTLYEFIDTVQAPIKFYESLQLSELRKHYIFRILKPDLSSQVNINWKSYDGISASMDIRGVRSEVEKTLEEVQKLENRIHRTSVTLPVGCVKALECLQADFFGSIGNRVVVDKPTIEKPSMTLMGKEDQINAMLIKLYNFLKTVCHADDLSRIDTHLLFTYMNYEELRYDEKNLQLFRATFPEAVIDWRTEPNGSIHLKIKSSPDDLTCINDILKRNVIIPFSLSRDASAVSTIASVLKQNGKLGDQVKLEVKADHIVLNSFNGDQLKAAYDVIYSAVDTYGYQQKQYADDRTLLLPGKLLEEIKAAANVYEVLAAFNSDSSNKGKLTVDIIGRAGNCEIFKTYLDMKLSSLTRLNLTSTNSSSVASRILQLNEKKSTDAFLLHCPERNDYWIGGDLEAVNSVEKFVNNDFVEERLSRYNRIMSCVNGHVRDYQWTPIDRLTKEFGPMWRTSDKLDTRINEGHKDEREAMEKVSNSLSRYSTFEGVFDGSIYNYNGRDSVLALLSRRHSLLDDKVSLQVLYDEGRDQVKVQMGGNKLSVNNMVDQFKKIERFRKEDCRFRSTIELPYTGNRYLNYLQAKLELPNHQLELPFFGIRHFWDPWVRCDLLWDRATLFKPPDDRKWKLGLSGAEEHVQEAENFMKKTIDNMNFHQIKFKIDDRKYAVAALTNFEFVQSAVAGGEVKLDVDFVDRNTNECYVNVFGDDGEKVTDLVSKIETFLSNGVKTEHIDLHNYNSDQSIPIKNCFFSSRIYEQLCQSKEKVFWWFNDDTRRITLWGDQNLVAEFKGEIREWLGSLTTKKKEYKDAGFWGAKVHYTPYQEYIRQRWHRLAFKFARSTGILYYSGTPEDLAEFEEYLSNEVRFTVKKERINFKDDQTSKALVHRIIVLYPGVFVEEKSPEIVLFGEKSDVLAVTALMKEAIGKGNKMKFAFRLRIVDRLVHVPYENAARVLGGHKFKEYWPELKFYIKGREICFDGPRKDIDECSHILDNMVSWEVPETLIRSASLFRDHRTKDGTFRDSHFIPPPLLHKLFIERAKGRHRSEKVTLFGHPEDVHPVTQYIEKVLPRMQLTRRSLQLNEEAALYLRKSDVWNYMFPQFEDTVAYSVGKDHSVEVVGDSGSVSYVLNSIKRFTEENFEVYEFPTGDHWKTRGYWNARTLDSIAQNFPRMQFDDYALRVYGHKNDIEGFQKMYSHQITYSSVLDMKESDVWNIDLGNLEN